MIGPRLERENLQKWARRGPITCESGLAPTSGTHVPLCVCQNWGGARKIRRLAPYVGWEQRFGVCLSVPMFHYLKIIDLYCVRVPLLRASSILKMFHSLKIIVLYYVRVPLLRASSILKHY